MKIIVHLDGGEIEISSPPTNNGNARFDFSEGETWGRLCQRFCETKLLHPPWLLSRLLIPLRPEDRGSCYRLRYGDGYSTVVRPAWAGGGAADDGEEGAAEANVTLRPRDGDGQVMPEAAMTAPESGATREVTLCIEKVGRAAEREGSRFPMTQDPFPADDRRTNVMRVWEHPKFAGAVDRFSVEGLAEHAASNAVDSGGKRKGLGLGLTTGGETKRTRRASGEMPASGSNDEGRGGDVAATDESARRAASAHLTVKDEPVPKGAAVKGVKGVERVKSVERVERVERVKSIEPSPRRKADEGTQGSPKSAADKEDANDANDANDAGNAKPVERRTDAETRPKRPPNAYILFSQDVRPKIVADNPTLKFVEVGRKVGEAYRALAKEEKKAYIDAARAALEEFKREHPNLPKATRKIKKKGKLTKGPPLGKEGGTKGKEVEEGDAAARAGQKGTPKSKKKEEEEPSSSVRGEEDNRNNGDDGEDDAKAEGAAVTAAQEEEKSNSHGGDDPANVPARPAKEFPPGWTTTDVPRKSGDKHDRYWFSPAKSYRFRSRAQATRFRESLDQVRKGGTPGGETEGEGAEGGETAGGPGRGTAGGGGEEEEAAAMELYARGEDEKKKKREKKKKKKEKKKKNKNDGNVGVSEKDVGSNGSDDQDGVPGGKRKNDAKGGGGNDGSGKKKRRGKAPIGTGEKKKGMANGDGNGDESKSVKDDDGNNNQ